MTVSTWKYPSDAERVIGFTYDIGIKNIAIIRTYEHRQIVEISRDSFWLTKIEMFHREVILNFNRLKIRMK